MNRLFTIWLMPCLAARFTSSLRHSMDELAFDVSHRSDRFARQSMQTLSPGYDDEESWPELLNVPELPTPTDVPVPGPHDVPVPEPIDVPPPDPHDIPPPNPRMSEFDPKPRSVP